MLLGHQLSAREWPDQGLDVDGLRASGWRPVPFRQFVLKIHGRCNLACDYCYVFESADQSWRARPAAMPAETIRRVADRIARHATAHGLDEVEVVLHGGEPMLAGLDLIDSAVREMRAAAPAGCRVGVTMQTNGVLLTRRALDLLGGHDVGIAVSLDGDRTGHDRHRRYANGRGSHAAVMRALDLLAGPYRPLYRGLLCTIDLANDPLRTLDALLESEPPRIDFLLPHGTWSEPPPGREPHGTGTPYADWLITVFDHWYGNRPRRAGIRYFEEIINLLLGGHSRSENIGLSPVALVVVDTDGTMQQVDTLKTSFAGAPETGLSVHDHDFDAALRHPGVVARQIGLAALCDTCMGCPVRDVCGGGAYTHRHQAGRGFQNPSVYCADLRKLIEHIGDRIRRDLATLQGRSR
ncbi:radical SAM protein [Actinomadura craniellae]|uniref:Radical SAM protein n=1 Tax=Actinomadura craniellae TaxID=2231787 RepID=A0A365H138_9ACTN|nr:FxsB family cyclophane-forming radical SAM/SPASM peptide maturase [Actinomadura craniellae]RAY12804.1 radical SAM protein [Actinomadura craniellae]